ncbi:E3 ubiquitin-protein ligase rfwd3.S-like [Diadema antillarum]|uniref:E3 ubiquitin-protein ligase rfwd3.S-like n=1 Tax=Diadema antillarum TaxID=105358 RepID=UPI003A83E587
MEGTMDEDDNSSRSTILLDSDDGEGSEDLYDSDATEISDGEEPANQPSSGTRGEAQDALVGNGTEMRADMPGASQAESESLLVIPQPSSQNQIRPELTSSDVLTAGASTSAAGASTSGLHHATGVTIDLDVPGPSGLSNFVRSQSSLHSAADARRVETAPEQSAERESEYANDRRTFDQSGTDIGGSLHRVRNNENSGNGGSATPSPSSSGIDAHRQSQAGPSANQAAANEEEEEPMEEGGVTNEDESSNDSMCDFQEAKKPAASAAKDSTDGSDDESQSCIICYETWTTSGSHRLVSLKCGHLFGQSCIEQWLKGQGGKCPQCNSKAKKTDIRVIYAKALKALDTSERDRAIKALEEEKELRKKAEMDAAQTQLRYVMALEEVKRMKAMLEAHQKSASRSGTSSMGSSSSDTPAGQSTGHYFLEKTITVSANGNCRVLTYDPANGILLASMPSPNQLFQGYGLKKISAMDFKTCQYIPIHTKPIRGVALDGRDDGLILTASVDKTLKITSLSSNTVVQSYNCPMPAWCCAWNSANTNYVYAGLQNGAVLIYDTRKPDAEVQTLTKEGSRCPIVSLRYVPSSTRVTFPCAGLLIGTLEGASFWEQLAPEDYRLHNLQLEGSCTSVTFEPTTRHCLAAFRPNKTHPATRYVMCEMKRQLVGDHGNSLVSSNPVQTFYGGTTMKVLTQAAMYCAPGEEEKLMVCAGDEASSALHIWDANVGTLKQKIPMGATALDVRPFASGGAYYLAALTDKLIKLCRWQQR